MLAGGGKEEEDQRLDDLSQSWQGCESSPCTADLCSLIFYSFLISLPQFAQM